ncbi:MAG: hypothetical protein H0V34_12180 [Gammaproteobacteria bacterium]|nr:hypothetical protein [Gammaproteobacteria bacterium]
MRSSSYNVALLCTAAELAPDRASLEIATSKGIPLYDGGSETATLPTVQDNLSLERHNFELHFLPIRGIDNASQNE